MAKPSAAAIEKIRLASRRHHAQREANKLCRCGRSWANGKRLCEICLKKNLEATKKSREGDKPNGKQKKA